jgi:uncharacterized membrane protein
MRQAMLAAHLILIAIGTGMSFSQLVNISLAKTQSGDMAKGLGLQRRTVTKIADIVIALIWVSGLALYANLGAVESGWFQAKLAFAITLTFSHMMARRTGGEMMRTGNAVLLGKLNLYVMGVFASAVIAIILAVPAMSRKAWM